MSDGADVKPGGRLWWGATATGLVAFGLAAWWGGGVILELELLGDASEVDRLLADADVTALRWSVLIDYLLLVSYAVVLVGAARWAGTLYRTAGLRHAARAIAGVAVLAALLDALENVGLLIMLGEQPASWLAPTTAGLAWVKFALLLLVAGYVARAVALRLDRREPVTDAAFAEADSRMSRGDVASTVRMSADPDTDSVGLEEAPDDDEDRRKQFQPREGRIGISCSGGGIRSASFNLGALQELGRAGVLSKASYVTAVSGGSYIAGALAIAAQARVVADPDQPAAFAPGTPEVRYLRNHTRYLASPRRAALQGIGRLLAGFAANVAFLVLVIFVLARPVGWLIGSRLLYPDLEAGDTLVVPAGVWAGLAVAAGLTAVAIGAQRARVERTDGAAAAVSGWIRRAGRATPSLLAVALAGLVTLQLLLPWLIVSLPGWLDTLPGIGAASSGEVGVPGFAWLQASGLLAALLGGLRALAKRHASKVAIAVAAVLLPVVILATFVMAAGDGATRGASGTWDAGLPDWAVWLAGVIVLLALLTWIRDITPLTLHRFYKRRLSSAYALQRTADGRAEPVPYERLLPLSAFPMAPAAADLTDAPSSGGGPELVVCAAANLTEHGTTPPGRNAVSFTFSASEVGGPDMGYLPSADIDAAMGSYHARHLTLPASIAISGAAVSPAMGKMTIRPLSALLALTNVRLGVWLPNPRWLRRYLDPGDLTRRPGWSYFLRELAGRYRLDDPLLYVSDGGHWENLGLVELLRRGCTQVYCFDAGGDRADTMFTIGQAIALARTELGLEIDLDVERIREPQVRRRGLFRRRSAAAKFAPTDHVVGTFRRVDDPPDAPPVGRIVYVKTAVTGDAPWDVRAYQERYPSFPNHSTALQLFDDERFEAYRALGAHAAVRALEALGAPRWPSLPKQGRIVLPASDDAEQTS